MKARGSSILRLMAVVLFVAVTLEALRSASEAWTTAYVSLTVCALLAATLGARFAPGRSARDWWFGFALFGWASLGATGSPIGEWLVTSKLAHQSFSLVFLQYLPYPRDASYTEARHLANVDYSRLAYQIHRSCLTLFAATLGAYFTVYLGRRSGRRNRGHLNPKRMSPQ